MIELRLYRTAFLPALLALIVVMFSLEDRPPPLPQALAADVLFQGRVAGTTLKQIVTAARDRRAGSIGDRATATHVARVLSDDGFETVVDRFHSDDGTPLVNVVGRRAGASRRQVVVIAARDAGSVPDATGSAADTAALIEMARVLQGTPSRKTVVLASLDGETLGGLGVRRLLAKLPDRDKIEAVLAVSNIAAPGPRIPPLVTWSNGTPQHGIGLERTATASIREEFGRLPGTDGTVAQMIHLAFPLGIGSQGIPLDRGVDAVRFSGSGVLPPPKSRQGLGDVNVDRLGGLGRAALRTVFSIDQGTRPLEHGPGEYVTVARKVLPGWALSLLAMSLILPAVVAAVDGFARARRRREPVGRWARWVLAGTLPLILGVVLAKLSVWFGIVADPPPTPVPPSLRPLHGGDVAVLGVLVGVVALAWMFGRRQLPGRLDPSAPGAGCALALLLSAVVLATWFVNPFAALLLVPALHLWLLAAIADVPERGPAPVLLVAGGLLPFAVVVLYFMDRLSMNPLDGLWYVFLLVTSGDVGILGTLLGCLVLGALASLVAILVARARKPRLELEEPERPPVFGPGGYAGPGALGGTESALRR